MVKEPRGRSQAAHTGDREVGRQFSLYRLLFKSKLLKREGKIGMMMVNKLFPTISC